MKFLLTVVALVAVARAQLAVPPIDSVQFEDTYTGTYQNKSLVYNVQGNNYTTVSLVVQGTNYPTNVSGLAAWATLDGQPIDTLPNTVVMLQRSADGGDLLVKGVLLPDSNVGVVFQSALPYLERNNATASAQFWTCQTEDSSGSLVITCADEPAGEVTSTWAVLPQQCKKGTKCVWSLATDEGDQGFTVCVGADAPHAYALQMDDGEIVHVKDGDVADSETPSHAAGVSEWARKLMRSHSSNKQFVRT